MKADIDRCQAENNIPGDEQTALLKKLEAEIVVYQSQIEAEWRADQEKKKVRDFDPGGVKVNISVKSGNGAAISVELWYNE